MEIQLSPTSTCNDARLDTATSLTHHRTHRRKHRRPLFGASPSSRVSPLVATCVAATRHAPLLRCFQHRPQHLALVASVGSSVRGSLAPLGWALACGLVGSCLVGWGEEGPCPPAPPPRPHCTPRRARGHRPAHGSRAPRYMPSTVRGELVLQRQRGRHGARCVHPYRPLSSRAHLAPNYTRATNIRVVHSSSRRSIERGLTVGDNHIEVMEVQLSPNLYM